VGKAIAKEKKKVIFPYPVASRPNLRFGNVWTFYPIFPFIEGWTFPEINIKGFVQTSLNGNRPGKKIIAQVWKGLLFPELCAAPVSHTGCTVLFALFINELPTSGALFFVLTEQNKERNILWLQMNHL
jgi:hypothetical protein